MAPTSKRWSCTCTIQFNSFKRKKKTSMENINGKQQEVVPQNQRGWPTLETHNSSAVTSVGIHCRHSREDSFSYSSIFSTDQNASVQLDMLNWLAVTKYFFSKSLSSTVSILFSIIFTVHGSFGFWEMKKISSRITPLLIRINHF